MHKIHAIVLCLPSIYIFSESSYRYVNSITYDWEVCGEVGRYVDNWPTLSNKMSA